MLSLSLRNYCKMVNCRDVHLNQGKIIWEGTGENVTYLEKADKKGCLLLNMIWSHLCTLGWSPMAMGGVIGEWLSLGMGFLELENSDGCVTHGNNKSPWIVYTFEGWILVWVCVCERERERERKRDRERERMDVCERAKESLRTRSWLSSG
jgi:hypothetical protein